MGGRRQHPEIVEAREAAVERGRVVPPHHPPQVEHLVEAVAPVREVVAEGGVLPRGPPDADADGQPTGRQLVEAGELVGQLQRVVLGRHEHARAEPDGRRHRRRPREGDHRVEQVRRRVALVGGLHEVVAHPEPGEPPLLGEPGGAADGLSGGDPAVLGKVDPDLEHHDVLPDGVAGCAAAGARRPGTRGTPSTADRWPIRDGRTSGGARVW